jgi:hypothetical protein
VGLFERSNLQPITRVHQEVASDVIKHDRIARRILIKFTPYNTQGFNL